MLLVWAPVQQRTTPKSGALRCPWGTDTFVASLAMTRETL